MSHLHDLLATRSWGLAFGPPNEATRLALTQFDIAKELDLAVGNRDAALAALAGLWLYHDFFDESHAISQDLSTPEGEYWHAILHRREPDAGNAAYWFRKLGHHAVFDRLAVATGSKWDPFDFIRHCEAARGRGDENEKNLERLQLLEWRLLFEWCREIASE